MFIDRHDLPGLTPEELAQAHLLDVAAQEEYGVRFHTYWFDPTCGSVFCMVEGPNQESVEAVHRDAHGHVASTVIELDPAAPLNALFGAIPLHPLGTPYAEPAMRAKIGKSVV